MGSKPRPPALPPRQSDSSLSPYSDPPPPYESHASSSETKNDLWTAQDPRSSSTQSLVPSQSEDRNERRKLLLIYIHGFMGNETSFRSFPAHVHNLLTLLLSETHIVHSKIYPRYRSKKNISFARDDFSKWLEPHEDSFTDVVLLGHSMGGLLSAEVVLMPPPPPAARPLKHRILGTINFDVPFLGMHPGVVKSGLSSIFLPPDEPGDKWSMEDNAVSTSDVSSVSTISSSSRQDTLWQPSRPDPNFNPSFTNDVVLPMRKGWMNALHFVHKHSDTLGELTKATKQLVTSHMEFGGAMANYGELKSRYGRIRALEEQNDAVRKSVIKGDDVPSRVRFVNYYTASTGRPRRQSTKSPGRLPESSANPSRSSVSANGNTEEVQRDRQSSGPNQTETDTSVPGDEGWEKAAETLTIEEPRSEAYVYEGQEIGETSSSTMLPSLPDPPSAPPPLDVSYIQDPETRKLVEKEHAAAVKIYEKAVKDREKTIKDRANLEKKQQRKEEKARLKAEKDAKKAVPASEMTQSQKEELRLEQEKQRMEAEGRRLRGEKEPEAAVPPSISEPAEPPSPMSSPATSPSQSRSASPAGTQKPKKDRKFCSLPPKDSNGERDPTWVRVFMQNVDEVGAHCGLFFVDERYERLVGDVSERVETWVREDSDMRFVTSESEFDR